MADALSPRLYGSPSSRCFAANCVALIGWMLCHHDFDFSLGNCLCRCLLFSQDQLVFLGIVAEGSRPLLFLVVCFKLSTTVGGS